MSGKNPLQFLEQITLEKPTKGAAKDMAQSNEPKVKLTAAHSAEVRHTTDYTKFNYLKGNRPVSAYHVQELILSFEERPELIELQPIHCNEKMEIIDGQHRLVALQTLELPVPYTVTPGLTIGEAQMLNALQRPWGMLDYARSYSADGNKHYAELLKLANEYPLPMSTLVLYATNKQTKRLHRDFRLGRFEIGNLKEVQAKLEMLADFADLAPWWFTAPFAKAFMNVLRHPKYDHQRMMAGAQKMGLQRKSNRVDYLLEFERAYNFRHSVDIERFV